MNESASSFRSDLRIALKPVLIVLLAMGLACVLLSARPSDPSEQLEVQLLSLLFFAVSVIAWWLDEWRLWAGRWFTIGALIAVIYLANIWSGVPGLLTLMVIPTTLAAALISLPAATGAALGETALLLLSKSVVGGVGSTTAIALMAIWATLGVMYAVYFPVHQQSRWLEEYSGRAQGLLEQARDRKAELEQTLKGLAHANRQLALANERMATLRMIAEGAQRAKAAFVASVSHEFRTPLNMIIGLIDFMVETPEIYDVALSPKMREDLEVVHRNCEYLSDMINDVLDLTRMEAGRLVLYRERVDLKEIIDRSVAAVRPLLDKKPLVMQIIVPDDLPEIYCDRTRIQQVVLNLISNAARLTEEGGVTIKVARQDQYVLVSVTDTGPGISPEDVERIFEPFCQGTGDLWRDKGGSGLGLSISKQFIKLHGGQMWLESELGVGTSFFFTLPMSPPMEHVAFSGYRIREDWVWREREFRTDQASPSDQLVKPRVVICDETGSLYPESVRFSDGVEFVDTRDFAQVTRELQQCPAHAVLLNALTFDDLWSLVEMVRQEAPGTPLVGCSIPRPVEAAKGAGALGHLVKPVTRTDLQKAIQAVGKPVKRVLVVDDDPDALQLFSRMLSVSDSTLEVVVASSGRQALDELRRASPDLVLLDIVMPDMDGWQVLEFMHQDETMENVPVFFVSAQDRAERPLASRFLLATMDEGLSLSKLFRCSIELSALLLKPEV